MHTLLKRVDDIDSLEYLHMTEAANEYNLSGTIVRLLNNIPTRITYQVVTDSYWRTKVVMIHQEHGTAMSDAHLSVTESRQWLTNGQAVPNTHGIFDIDLEVTPATNTLPIRRLNLQVGESAEVSALWVRFPSLTLERLEQRYTRLAPNQYRYEALSIGFETLLDVDDVGLVTHYHNGWRAVP